MASLLPEGRERSRSGLARQTKISRQQLTQWFDGRGEPRFSALGEAAERLGVRRVDLVAAYDGVTAPETQETPRPEWAGGLEEQLDGIERLVVAIAGVTPGVDLGLVREMRRERDVLQRSQQPDEARQSEDPRPPGTPAGTGR